MDMQEVDGENDGEGSEDMDVDEQAQKQQLQQRGKLAAQQAAQQSNGNNRNRNGAKGKNQDPQFQHNHEFWTEFLEKNLKYQTEPFGGNNPVFIPFVTNESTYQDRYEVNEMQHHKDEKKN